VLNPPSSAAVALRQPIDYYPTAGGNLCKACYERLVARQQRERSQANNAIDVLAGRFPWYWLECVWHRPKGSPIALGGGEQKLKGRMKAIFAAIAILCCFALNARAFAQAMPIPADNPPDRPQGRNWQATFLRATAVDQ
jgi:hypothetical protein